jgi:cell division protein FtsB
VRLPHAIQRNRKRLGYGMLVVAAAAWLQASGLDTAIALRDSWTEEERLSAGIDELERQNKALVEDNQALRSNGFRVEQLAREKMGLARESEFVVVVPGKR